MDYEKKYKELILWGFIDDISDEYPECNDFEKIVLAFRKNNWCYGAIQKQLGMPSKKVLRGVLLKWAPELIDDGKPKVIAPTAYSEIYNILAHTDKKVWNIFGEDTELFIKDNKIYYNGDPLEYYTETEHNQILNEIKNE